MTDDDAADRERRSDQGLSEPSAAPDEASAVMAQVARTLQREHASVDGTLVAITAAAVGGVPGAEHAGISLVRRGGGVENRAATGDLVVALNRAQTELNEGPCLDSIWTERTVRIDDMRTDERWPSFSTRAVELGIQSSLSLQLFVDHGTLGALTLYATEPHAFDAAAEDTGLVFAAHAAIALVGARQEATMIVGLTSRDLIGQAKGILMERFRIDAHEAFTLLARVSQRTNTTVRAVSDHLARTGAVEPSDRSGWPDR